MAQTFPIRGKKPLRNDPLICLCNEVPRSEVVRAIRNGACSLAKIFDETFAGCGPCGGSCQPELVQLLQQELDSPTKPKPGG